MQSIAAFLIAEHIQELLREADAGRLEKAVARSNGGRRSWRCAVGAGMRRLSARLADLARRLDPTIPARSYGRE